eukprot:1143634-Pelagomonas_calceolata.AAC.2
MLVWGFGGDGPCCCCCCPTSAMWPMEVLARLRLVSPRLPCHDAPELRGTPLLTTPPEGCRRCRGEDMLELSTDRRLAGKPGCSWSTCVGVNAVAADTKDEHRLPTLGLSTDRRLAGKPAAAAGAPLCGCRHGCSRQARSICLQARAAGN